MSTSQRARGLQPYTPFALALDFLVRPVFPRRPHILVPCMLKSGSTFLAHALAAHGGLRRARLTPTWGAREQELCEIRLSYYNHLGYVSQHHIKNSEWTQELIRRYRMTTVVLIRDLFDITVSLRDHIRRESPVMSVAHFTAEHARMPDEELEEAVADLAIPWFVNFYAGWRQDSNALFMDYEDLTTDPAAVLATILDRASVKATPASIARALEKVEGQSNRYNKGQKGRGQRLSPQVKEKIIRQLRYYPSILDDIYVQKMLAAAG